MNRVLAILTITITALLGNTVFGGDVYSSLMDEFSKYPHRLPGSDNLENCFQAVEAQLKAAGLTPHRQTFDTLAPETKACHLTVDGKEVGPVYPLGPNGIALTTLGKRVLEGPLVWIGDGSLAEQDELPIKGAIALMNFDAPHMDLAFSQGAKAVVFIGNGTESQWDMVRHYTHLNISVPRFYMSTATAKKFGLLSGQPLKAKKATIQSTVVWNDVVGCNLWTAIPGKEGKEFDLGAEEAILLCVNLDTFGIVPDYCPQQRQAANAALLTQVACSLAKTQPERTIFIVYFGSHYSAQDASRMFYYCYEKTEIGGKNTDPLDMRQKCYEDEREMIQRKITILKSEDPLTHKDTEYRTEAILLLKRKLKSWVEALNFEIREIVIGAQRRGLKHEEIEKQQLTAKQKETKKKWNLLRRQVQKRNITSKEDFKIVIREVCKELQQYENQVDQSLKNNASFQELRAALLGKVLVGHYNFDFADSTNNWIFSPTVTPRLAFDKGSSRSQPEDSAKFKKNLSLLSKVYDKVTETSPELTPELDTNALKYIGRISSLCVPQERSCTGAIALGSSVYGYNLMTIGNDLRYDEMPVKVSCKLDGLASTLTTFFSEAANSRSLSDTCMFKKSDRQKLHTYRFEDDVYYGRRFDTFAKGSVEIEGPAPNAVATYTLGGTELTPLIPANTTVAIARIRKSGHIFMPRTLAHWNNPQGYGFNDVGELVRFSTPGRNDRLFYGYGGGGFSPFDPATYSLHGTKILNALNDSQFKKHHVYPSSRQFGFYVDRPLEYKYLGKGILMLGNTEKNPKGFGLNIAPEAIVATNTLKQASHDYSILNGSRLDMLRRRNIVNDSIEILHSECRDHLEQAHVSRDEGKISEAFGHELFATALGYRACDPLRSMSNDMVQAVVILLILSIPFAFVMERLVFGFTSIYYQVAGFAGVFILTFVLLYLTHPAFSLASSPLVIFLAFVIIIMSALVIYIVMSKFRMELRAIQGLASTVHGAASDSSTAVASVLIGITGMRNRPLKTFLTSATVVLLTFTILVFASFSSKIGVIETYMGKGEGVNRIEIRRFSFLDIPEAMLTSIETLYGQDWDIYRRGACFTDPSKVVQYSDRLVYSPKSREYVQLQSLIGFTPGEFQANPDLAKISKQFAQYKGELPPLFLPQVYVDKLQVAVGDTLLINGREFSFQGSFDQAAMNEFTNIDGSRITPPDFKSTLQEMEMDDNNQLTKSADEQLSQIDTNSFVYFSALESGLTTYKALKPLGVITNSVVMYPKENAMIRKTAQEIAQVFLGPLYAKGSDGASQYFFTRDVQTAGFTEVIVPLLLGGLIIFSSLLGSIVEREKEIFTYSALGLSPPDVGFLFFAESSVYAIVGGMGGYLFSQLIAKMLTVLASFGLFHPPEMNFSSLASVSTILVVMATVILSTIYPAIKAGKSANPGVARKWQMPKPEGDALKFEFPFTVSESDMAGILSFIREHFENHGDATLGNFAATGVNIFKEEVDKHNSMGIQAHVSLAPFDLGVAQSFKLYSKPSEIEGIDEVVVELNKVNGTAGAWLRGNRTFIDELRNQFLLWRSLPVETVEHYRSETEATLGLGTKEDDDSIEDIT